MSHSQELDDLRLYLSTLPPGPVPDIEGLLARLKPAWHHLEGSESNSMAAYKLDRIEDPDWAPPILSFVVDRHGATVLGSTRGELQHWTVNLDTDEAIRGARWMAPADAEGGTSCGTTGQPDRVVVGRQLGVLVRGPVDRQSPRRSSHSGRGVSADDRRPSPALPVRTQAEAPEPGLDRGECQPVPTYWWRIRTA